MFIKVFCSISAVILSRQDGASLRLLDPQTRAAAIRRVITTANAVCAESMLGRRYPSQILGSVVLLVDLGESSEGVKYHENLIRSTRDIYTVLRSVGTLESLDQVSIYTTVKMIRVPFVTNTSRRAIAVMPRGYL